MANARFEQPAHLMFPGFSLEESGRLVEKLEAAARSAEVFAGSVGKADLNVEFSLSERLSLTWMRRRNGSFAVRLIVGLLSPECLPAPVEEAGADDYRKALRSGVLHGLGRLLFSPGPEDPDPVAIALNDPRPRRHSRLLRKLVATERGSDAILGLLERLEADRCDGLLRLRFPHAAHLLQGGDTRAERWAQSAGADMALLGEAGLLLRRQEHVPSRLSGRLRASLNRVLSAGELAGAYALAEFLLWDLLPQMLSAEMLGGDRTDKSPESFAGDPEALRRELEPLAADLELNARGTAQPIWGEIVPLPHVDGGEVLLRVEVAKGSELEPTEINRKVLERLAADYGPRAREAFAQEVPALRRALRANWERRHRGRYRAGKHIGTSNLRRYVIQGDLRLFQRLETPQKTSYYFHLLVDASYSMLQNDNASKALAVAAAFTEVLQTIRVPVDVTLYASELTRVHDHRTGTFSTDFGGDFGYLISGTREVEAVAWAAAQAQSVTADHRMIVVLTDGTPVRDVLPLLGASELAPYYSETLVPWLKRVNIDLMGLGLGICPDYHPRSLCLTEGWETLPVFLELLDEIVAEARAASLALWS